jgi:hypothetical protein
MADPDLLKSVCAIIGTDGGVTIEELQVLRGLAERSGLRRVVIDDVIAKSQADAHVLDAHRETIMNDPERAMNELIGVARADGEIKDGHTSMLLWRFATALDIGADRFDALMKG